MTKTIAALSLCCALMMAQHVSADVYNLKVVTDANPDYTDLDSLVHSATSRWKTDAEKCWAMYYWNHIARRQTNPMELHGVALTDPIRQFNDYGFTMCSTISGINCAIWQHMGYPVKYYDVAVHTVPEVKYDDKWHMFDNSLSCIYTECDGKTIAGLEDLGKTMGCEKSGGKEEPGHIVLYHAMNGTSVDGFLEGADTIRDLRHLGEDTFKPEYLKYRYYYNDAETGHRYILNLRDGESYMRSYTRLDKPQSSEGSKDSFSSDPAFFTPNGKDKDGKPRDPEAKNPRYKIRGNGVRTWTPQPAKDGIYKVEGANVITSLKISADSSGPIAISTDNGMNFKEVEPGGQKVDLKLIEEVNGAYEVLVKAPDAKNLKFETITQVNSKTQPRLNLGKNTVYIGAGDQTESIVLWPELQGDKYKAMCIESENIKTKKEHEGWNGVLSVEGAGEGHITFKIDAPDDLTKLIQTARMYVRKKGAEVRFEHSFDNGRTWTNSFTFNDTEQPWDDIHHQVTTEIPAGAKSVLFKYVLKDCSLYSIRMEANHKVPKSSPTPMEVTFNWSERQADYSLVKRSHTQLVEKLPMKYDINVGGADHPVVESLAIKEGKTDGAKYGYSDGKDAGGEKYVGNWVTYGKNFAQGKSYTLSVPPAEKAWDSGDPDLKKLTDGRVGSSYSGGQSYKEGPLWNKGSKPEITVDLGEAQKIGAFRIHIHGYPAQDAVQGKVKDEVEVLVSDDGKEFKPAGKFDFRLRWKDIPVNYMYSDEELFVAHNHTLKLDQPISARFVRYAIKPSRSMVVSEVQAIEDVKSEPFDLKIALPESK